MVAPSSTPEYKAWYNAVDRCHNPEHLAFKWYGARGVVVCARWRDSFDSFLADMGPRPGRRMELDRYPDNGGNYEPTNCRWATKSQNRLNTRRNRLIEFNGRRQTLQEWSRELGIARETIYFRLSKGWLVERALFQPVSPTRSNPGRRDTKRVRKIAFHGKSQSICEWATQTGLRDSVIGQRLRAGWSVKKTLTTPSLNQKAERATISQNLF